MQNFMLQNLQLALQLGVPQINMMRLRMVYMKIWLVRHGETRTGEDGLYKPHHGLTARGLEQADQVAMALAGYSIDICYSSVLPRAVETMQRFIAIDGLDGVRIENLNEIDAGNISVASPEIKRQIINHESNLDFSPFGGEDPERFFRRVADGWNELLTDANTRGVERVAAFLHGGTIGAIIDYMEHNTFDYHSRPRMPNCAYTVIDLSEDEDYRWRGWETNHISDHTS